MTKNYEFDAKKELFLQKLAPEELLDESDAYLYTKVIKNIQKTKSKKQKKLVKEK